MPNDQPQELLPCPFCGRAPVLKHVPFSREVLAQVPDPDAYWWIGCEIDANITGCGIGHSSIDKAVAIEKWNTRVARPDEVEVHPVDDGRVAEIRKRLAHATPGPWERETDEQYVSAERKHYLQQWIIDSDGKRLLDADSSDLVLLGLDDEGTEYDINATNNLDFAAHAREDIPYLLSLVESQPDEIRGFQDGVRDHLISFGVPDDRIDGAGCDSGDPLDFTKAEITQAFSYIEDKHVAEVAALRAENERFWALVYVPKILADDEELTYRDYADAKLRQVEELKQRDAQSRESGCWCDEHGHPCKGCEIKQERDELSEEMESCHAMLDLYYQEDPESCSADTLETRVQVHLTEANAIRCERESLTRQLAEARDFTEKISETTKGENLNVTRKT